MSAGDPETERMRQGDKERWGKYAYLSFLLLLLCSVHSFAQDPNGTITGRVIAEDGQPIPHAKVNISAVDSGEKRAMGGRVEIVADDEGKFAAEGLDPVPYLISAWAPGYVPVSGRPALDSLEASERRFARIGESVTVKLVRGGVIAGHVTSATGEPVIGVPVKVTLGRDEAGRPTNNPGYGDSQTWTTDDRGFYRIYGLAPGSYVVAAGGGDSSSTRPTPFAGQVKTYHPSSTRDAATLVKVSSGAEATGIDIRYRDENGFAISGKISSGTKATPGAIEAWTEVFLRNPTSGDTIAKTSFQPAGNQSGYAFYGIPNGEYEVVSQTEGTDGDSQLASTPRRVRVNGGDVNGIDLTLTPTASISGSVVIEKAAANVQKCESPRKSYPEDIIVKARLDEPNEKREFLLPSGIGMSYDKGAFAVRNLKPGRHRIELELPDESWYIKAMVMGSKTPAMDPLAGLTLKSGDKLTGLTITIAPGAASLKGKVTAAENARLPLRLRIHLVPAEAEAKDEVLRFAETGADGDGAFAFANLAPGKYWLLARATPSSEADDKPSRPARWEASERAKLRKEAEMANLVIELKPCQRIADYALPVTK